MKLMFILEEAVVEVLMYHFLKQPEIILLSRICGTTLKYDNKFIFLFLKIMLCIYVLRQ